MNRWVATFLERSLNLPQVRTLKVREFPRMGGWGQIHIIVQQRPFLNPHLCYAKLSLSTIVGKLRAVNWLDD